MTAAPLVISLGPDHCVATWECFLVQIWRRATTLPAARKVREAARALAAAREGALATIIVVEPDAAMPDAEARAVLAGMVSDQAGRMVAAALVQEGSGFKAAAIRSIMIGMMIVARNPFPHKVVSDLAEARDWLATEKRLPADRIAELPRVIEELRAKIGSRTR